MSALKISAPSRTRARKLAVKSAYLLLNNAPRVHYSQGSQRFDGIRRHLRAYKGQYPPYSDCSSSSTWCLWDATRRYHLADFVNGQSWTAGYTGTMQKHGTRIRVRTVGGRPVNFLPGDLVFYGDQGGGVAEHVAVYVGGGRVISHGSEAGPFLIAWNYRGVNEVRRYIR